jgi:hypothetical protein
MKVLKEGVFIRERGAVAGTGFYILDSSSVASTACERTDHRRRTTPEAGHALEVLGHAIEYLSDELSHEGGSLSADNEQVQAILILMALNRQIYFGCPVVPTVRERLRALLRSFFS